MALELKEWVDLVFGQARVPMRLGELRGPNRATLLRLTEVFENAATLLKPYSDETLNQAFWDLAGDALLALRDETIDWSLRHQLIRSFETLFRDVFTVRCKPVLGHCNEEGSPLNTACYMWWDFDCWVASSDPLSRNPLDAAYLASMQSILRIGHVACQESALHGLGHWHWAHGAAVEAIIDEFLQRERQLPARLREYAFSARRGCVL